MASFSGKKNSLSISVIIFHARVVVIGMKD
jgi:hypothetical protein